MPTDEKKVALWRLFLLTSMAGAVDLGYAVECTYVVPLLVASGLSLTLSTVLITLSPVVGLLFQGFIGAVSDKCTCSWGRRRPFIVLFSLTAIIGFAGAPYCFYFDKLNITHYLVIGGVVLCVFLSDFSMGVLLLPTRAYLLDVISVSQSRTGNFITSVAVGTGAALGYGLGAVDWLDITGLNLNASIVNQVKLVYGIAAATFLVATFCTIISVKEQNPSRPPEGSGQINAETVPLINKQKTCSPFSDNFCQMLGESTIGIIKFAYYMSYDMWFLWFMSALAIAADFSFTFSLSTFVGVAVYKGNSSSPEDSLSYQLYTKGVRMGSLGLAIATVFCAVISFILSLDSVSRWIRLKTILLITIAIFVCALCSLMYFRELYQVYLLVAMYGPFFAAVTCVPYAFIPIYHVSKLKDLLRN